MSAEDKEFRRLSIREDTKEEFSFDELAKGLASGKISRGRALKLVGAAVLGGGVLTLLPGVARGQVEAEAAQGCPEGQRAINNRRCPTNSCAAGEPGCRCAETVNGNKRCVRFNREDCPSTDQCDTNEDCAGDEVCIKVGGCCGKPRRNLCARACTL